MASENRSVNSVTGEVRLGRGFVSDVDPVEVMGLPRYNYPHPMSPPNLRVYHNFKFGSFDIYWDDPRLDVRNSTHDIVGMNIYRSIDSSEGPYKLVNSTPVTVFFYRDVSESLDVVDEVIDQSNIRYERDFITIKTLNYPFYSAKENAVEKDLDNIIVKVNGVRALPHSMNAMTGEIVFSTKPLRDPVTKRDFVLNIPTDSSTVTVSYKYSNLILQDKKSFDQRIFYKCTTINADGVETPLEKCYEASYQDSEHLTYIWANIITKQNFLLDQAGERAYLFIQKSIGTPCTRHDNATETLYGDLRWRNCEYCYGTGLLGGYLGPFEVQIAPFDAEISYKHSRTGRVVSKQNETFLTSYPVVRQGDLLVRQNGERYMVGPVKRKEPNGVLVQQNFTIFVVPPTDILYLLPLYGPPKFDNQRNDEIDLEKRHLNVKGKTPRYRNIHYIPEDGV